MTVLLSELVPILEAEAELYRGLLEIMRREREAMVGLRRDEMDRAIGRKETLIRQLQAVEQSRSDLVLRLADRRGCRADELTLGRLVQAAPEDVKPELRRCRRMLRLLVRRLREETRRSNDLCRHIGELLHAFYGTAKGMAASGPVYHRGGRLDEMRLNGRLVRHEI